MELIYMIPDVPKLRIIGITELVTVFDPKYKAICIVDAPPFAAAIQCVVLEDVHNYSVYFHKPVRFSWHRQYLQRR